MKRSSTKSISTATDSLTSLLQMIDEGKRCNVVLGTVLKDLARVFKKHAKANSMYHLAGSFWLTGANNAAYGSEFTVATTDGAVTTTHSSLSVTRIISS